MCKEYAEFVKINTKNNVFAERMVEDGFFLNSPLMDMTVGEMLFKLRSQEGLRESVDNTYNTYLTEHVERRMLDESFTLNMCLDFVEITSFSDYIMDNVVKHIRGSYEIMEENAVEYLIHYFASAGKFFNMINNK